MGIAALSLLINALVLAAGIQQLPEIAWILGPAWAVQCIGVVAMFAGWQRRGAQLTLGGSALFVPIGLLGAYGAREVLDRLEAERLVARRLAAAQETP